MLGHPFLLAVAILLLADALPGAPAPAAPLVPTTGAHARGALPAQAAAPTTAPAATRPRWPDETNTGLAPGVQLTPIESVTADKPGQVVENLDVTGQILVAAPDVVIRNCRITAAAGKVAVKIEREITGTLVENCEITGPASSNGVSGSNYIARRLHVHHMGSDAFRVARNVVIEDCYVHDFGIAPKSHGDGVQMYPTTGGNITIRRNHFDARGANAALFQVNGGWTIEGNYLHGGNYTVQCGGEAHNVFRDNTFGRDAKYGPIRVGSGNAADLVWQGNRFTDGRPVALKITRPASRPSPATLPATPPPGPQQSSE